MKNDFLTQIKDFIIANNRVTIDDLCEEFHVSMSTIRRYLTEIAKDNNFQKIYGGIRVREDSEAHLKLHRLKRNQVDEAKLLIAKKAAEYIEENDIIYIDSGTTTRHILDFVPQDIKITVITNSYFVINTAIEQLPNITLITLPGILDRTKKSFICSKSSLFLDSYNIHKAFLACTGLTIRDGATNTFYEENINKKKVVEKSDKIFLLADSKKFGVSTLMTYCPLNKIQNLITNEMPPEDFCKSFENYHNRIILATN